MKLAVETMTAAHVEALAEVEKENFTYYDAELDVNVTRPGFWTKHNFVENSTARKSDNRALAAVVNTPNGRYVQGGLVFQIIKDESRYHILKFTVSPKVLNPEAAREVLLAALLKRLENNHFKIISITTDDYDYALLAFLRKHGFKAQLLSNKEKPFADKWFCTLKFK